METYNHYLNTYNSYDQNLQGDLPLAIFMIKLLSLKSHLINFIPEYKFKPVIEVDVKHLKHLMNLGFSETQSTNALIQNGNSHEKAENWLLLGGPDYPFNDKFNEYMQSDKPLKLRYYLQVDFWNELDDILREADKSIKDEINHLNDLFGYVEKNSYDSLNTYYTCTKIPENRQELYDKYLSDIINLDYTKQQRDDKDTIEKWLSNVDTQRIDGISKELRCNVVLDRIKTRIKLKYPIDTFKNNLRKIIQFNDKESVYKLLYSIRDVYILGLV